MKLYLSGPMTQFSDSNYNFPAFYKAQGLLEMLGHDVVNPARMDIDAGLVKYAPSQSRLVTDARFTIQDAMRRDIKAIADCDAVVLLPGWESSVGAGKELRVAREDFGMPAFELRLDTHGWPILESV
jgi:hypothetical protein